MGERDKRKVLLRDKVRLYFDRGAASRNEFKDPFTSFTYQEKRKDIIKLLPNNAKDILDVGCGTGTFEGILLLYKNKSDMNITGIDGSPKCIEVAKSKQIPNAVFLCGDAESLPFRDNSFDCCLLIEVIEHISDKEGTVKELKRVLRTDGTLIITTPNKEDVVLRLHNLLMTLTMKITRQRIIHKDEYLSTKELLALVGGAGLNVTKLMTRYLIPLSLAVPVVGGTWGIIPPLTPSLNLKLLNFLLKLEEKHKLPSLIRRYLCWTIFLCAVKED